MRSRRIVLLLLREAGIGLALVLLVILFLALAPNFGTRLNFTNILSQISINTAVAVGMTFVILLGGIDLSVGSVLALAAVVASIFLSSDSPHSVVERWHLQPGASILLACVASIVVGMGCGFFNGWVSERWKIHSFVVTLGMLNIARGAALEVSASRTSSSFPSGFNALSNATLGYGIVHAPVIFLIAAAAVVAGRFVLARTVFGRLVYAIGNNEEAVRLSGHDPGWIKVVAFTLTGAMVGVAAIMQMIRLGISSPILSVGAELNAIAAVVIGGTSMSGGKGSMVGTFLGACIMGILNNGLLLLGMGDFARQIVTGFMIILAVIVDKYRARAVVRITSWAPAHAEPSPGLPAP